MLQPMGTELSDPHPPHLEGVLTDAHDQTWGHRHSKDLNPWSLGCLKCLCHSLHSFILREAAPSSPVSSACLQPSKEAFPTLPNEPNCKL